MFKLLQKVPYCSIAMLEQGEIEDSWALKELPFPPLTQNNNLRFDWKILLTNQD